MKQEMDTLMQASDLSLHGILCLSKEYEDGLYRKQLLLYSQQDKDKNQYPKLIEWLESIQDMGLKEKKEIEILDAQMTTWEIGNTKYSRKNLESLLNEFYKL